MCLLDTTFICYDFKPLDLVWHEHDLFLYSFTQYELASASACCGHKNNYEVPLNSAQDQRTSVETHTEILQDSKAGTCLSLRWSPNHVIHVKSMQLTSKVVRSVFTVDVNTTVVMMTVCAPRFQSISGVLFQGMTLSNT